MLTDNTAASTISNNVVSGFSNTYSANTKFYCIHVDGYNSTTAQLTVEVSGNTIGSSSSANALVFNESSDCRLDVFPIHIGDFSSSVQYRFTGTISSNIIGGINTGSTYVPWQVYIQGIVGSGNSASGFTISGNTIGSASAPITIGTSVTTAAWIFNGIYLTDYSSNGPNYTLTNNVISYITNFSNSSSAEMNGIYNNQSSTSSTKTISGNTITDLTSGYMVVGIFYPNGYPRNSTISGNTIKNLSAGNHCYGMYLDCGYSTVVSSNFISRLSTTNTSCTVYGIYNSLKATTGNSVYNNIISLGKNSAGSDLGNILIYGIHDNGYSNYYFNTISITGTVASASNNTFAFCRPYSNSNNGTSIKDNIFCNARSNSSGSAKHYSIHIPVNS